MAKVDSEVKEGPSRPHRRIRTKDSRIGDSSSEDSRTKDTLTLMEPAPDGPTVIDIIPNVKTHVAYYIWHGVHVI